MIEAMPGMLYADCRVAQPMVRREWLENGYRSDTSGRGVEPFVAVQWDTALDLAAAEIDRVRTEHGNEAIYASSGWASAGTFHSAATQLKRFFNDAGGFVDQVTNYSFGSASVIVPRVTGGMEPVMRPTSWPISSPIRSCWSPLVGFRPRTTRCRRTASPDMKLRTTCAMPRPGLISFRSALSRTILSTNWMSTGSRRGQILMWR